MSGNPSDIGQRPPPDPPSLNQREADILATIRAAYVDITATNQAEEPLTTFIMQPAQLTTRYKLAAFSKGQPNCVILVQNLARAFDAMGIGADIRKTLWNLPTVRNETWPCLVKRTIAGMIGQANKPASCPQPGTAWDLMNKQLDEWDRDEDPDEDEPRVPPSTTPFNIRSEEGTAQGVAWNQRARDRAPAKAIVVKTREGTHELVMSPFTGPIAVRDLSTAIFYNQARTPLLHRIWFLSWTDLLPINEAQPSTWESQWDLNTTTTQAVDLRRTRKARKNPADRVLPGFSPTTTRGLPRVENQAVQRIQADITPPRQPSDQVKDPQALHDGPNASHHTPRAPTTRASGRKSPPDSLGTQAKPDPPLVAIMIDVEGMGLYTDTPCGSTTPRKLTAVSEFAATISIPEQAETIGYIHGLINEDYPMAVFDQACYNTAGITGLPPLTFKRADGQPLFTPGLVFPSVRDCTDALVEIVKDFEARGHQVALLAQDDKMEREVLTNPQYVWDPDFLASRLTDIAQIKPSRITDQWKNAIRRIKSAKTDHVHDYIKSHQSQAAAKPCCPHHKRINPSYHCALADTLLYTGLLINALDREYGEAEQIDLKRLAPVLTNTTSKMLANRDDLHEGVLSKRGITPPSKLEALYESDAIRTGVTDYTRYELPPGTTIRSYIHDAVLIMRDGSLDTLRERAIALNPDKTVPGLGLIGTTSEPLPNTTTYSRIDQLSIDDLLHLFPHDNDLIGGIPRDNRTQAFNQVLEKYPWIATSRLTAANVGYPHSGDPFPLFAQTIPPAWGVAERASPKHDYRNNMGQTQVTYPHTKVVETTFTSSTPSSLPRPRMRLWNQPAPSTRGAQLKRWTATIDRFDGSPPPSYEVPRDFATFLCEQRAHRETQARRGPRNANQTPWPRQEAQNHQERPHSGWTPPEHNQPLPTTQSLPNDNPPRTQATKPTQWGRTPPWRSTIDASARPNPPQTNTNTPALTGAPMRAPHPQASEQEITILRQEVEELRRAKEQEAAKANQAMEQLRADSAASRETNARSLDAMQKVLTSLAMEVTRSSAARQDLHEKNTRLTTETDALHRSVASLRDDLEEAKRKATRQAAVEKKLQKAKQELERELGHLKTKAPALQATKRQTQMSTDNSTQPRPRDELWGPAPPPGNTPDKAAQERAPPTPTSPNPNPIPATTQHTTQTEAILQLMTRLSQDPEAMAKAILDSARGH